MDDREIAKIVVEAMLDFITVTKREPITGASIGFLETMVAASLMKHRLNNPNAADGKKACVCPSNRAEYSKYCPVHGYVG